MGRTSMFCCFSYGRRHAGGVRRQQPTSLERMQRCVTGALAWSSQTEDLAKTKSPTSSASTFRTILILVWSKTTPRGNSGSFRASQIRDIHMPVLMGPERLLEPLPLRAGFGFQPARARQL